MAYVTLQEMRAEGISLEEYGNDAYIEKRIAIAQSFIENVTGRFFEPRDLTLKLSGSGISILSLPITPTSDTAITEIREDADAISTDLYTVIVTEFPDSRYNPKIIRIGGVWSKGLYNYEVDGEFGFVTSAGETPEDIKHLCKRIAMWNLPKIGVASASREDQIVEEQLGDYRYRLSEAQQSGGFFNDPKIDLILEQYKVKRILAV